MYVLGFAHVKVYYRFVVCVCSGVVWFNATRVMVGVRFLCHCIIVVLALK